MLLSQTSDENALSSLPHQFLFKRESKNEEKDCSQVDNDQLS